MTSGFPTITTERLLLRRFADSDLENVFKGLSHPDVIRYYGVSYSSMEAARVQMSWFANLEKTGTGIWWVICSLNNSVFYGAGGFNNISVQHRKAEIGFWLMPAFWQQGIMREALPLICDYGFSTLRLHRIEGVVETGNNNSKKVMEKLSFVHEGTLRECEIKNGTFISLDMYALLRDS